MIHSRRPEDQPLLNELSALCPARKPGKGKNMMWPIVSASVMIAETLAAPTFYELEDEDVNEILDGTNNHSKRSIGCGSRSAIARCVATIKSSLLLGIIRLSPYLETICSWLREAT
jgi:hypothetical protein